MLGTTGPHGSSVRFMWSCIVIAVGSHGSQMRVM